MGQRPIPDLVGRSAELQLIDSLLDRLGGAGMLLRGEPGVGRTALLDAAAERAAARGFRVLRASGVPFETGIGFSALHQLLDPLRGQVDRLAGEHRDALDEVLQLTPVPSDNPPLITAVLALLRSVAADRPLLLIADDLQWVDRASATVLGFAARRVDGEPMALLAAERTLSDGFLDGVRDDVRLTEREIEPLAAQPAATLLDARHPDVVPPVRRRLLAEAAGNPLALVELPATLSDRQCRGQDPLPEFLPLTGRLEAAITAELPDLTAPARQALLLAALDPAAGLTAMRADLGAAPLAGLFRSDRTTGRPGFRHPLIRSAIVRAARPDERRAAHLRLAEALTGEPDRRAWHLAEAATGPDEEVAQALETAALSISRNGRGAAAVDPLVRAGELSPHPTDRSRRLIEAAYIAGATGPLDRVTRLLADARRADDARQASGVPTSSVFASATAVYLMYGEGQVDAAHRLLARALADSDTAHANSDWIEDILYSLLNASIFGGRQELWRLLGDALARFDPDGTTAVRLCYEALIDPGPAPRRVREGLLSALDTLPADAPPWRLIPLAYAAMGTDTLGGYRHLCRSMIDRELDCGAVGAAITGYLVLSGDSYHRGQWDESEDLARQGLELAATLGYQLLECHLRAHLAFVAGTRGQAEVARTLSDEVTRWAAPRGLGNTLAFAWYARALTAIGQGQYEEAYLQATRLNRDGTFAPGMISSWTVMDFVEAAVRTGRLEEARAYVAAAQRAGTADMSPRRALSSLGAAALAAPDDQAGPLFEAALSVPDADRWPFEQARIQLAYGQWLRRTRDNARARLHLRAALETLDRLGARPWAVRAHNELRAAGVAEGVSPDSRAAALTTQERRIATLAAGGLTNKQIGQQLYLSHRTVSGHLHRIFPKLGITSRAALRDALGADAPATTQGSWSSPAGHDDVAAGDVRRPRRDEP